MDDLLFICLTINRALSIASHNRLHSLGVRLTDLDGIQSERHAQLTSTLETSIGTLPTHEILSKTISDKINPLQSWMETSVRSPLAEKLERVEMSTQVSIQYSRHSSKSLSSLGSQISEHLSQQSQQIEDLKRLINDKLARPAESAAKAPDYFCGCPTGIDEAFVENWCVYCGDRIGNLDARSRGKHLLDKHNYDGCPDGFSHRKWHVFFKHLVVYHKANQFAHSSKEVFQDHRNIASCGILNLSRPDKSLVEVAENMTYTLETDRRLLISDLTARVREIVNNLISRATDQAWDLSKLTPSVLEFLGEMDWQLHCVCEAHFILNIDLDFQIDMDYLDTVYRIAFGHNRYEQFEGYKAYVRKMHDLCPERPDLLVQFRPSLQYLSNLDGECNILLSDRIIEQGLYDLWFQPNEIQPPHPGNNRAISKEEQINTWMLRILGTSQCSRVLVSQHFKIGAEQDHRLVSWVLKNLAHWSIEVPDHEDLKNASEGAVASRYNLSSREFYIDRNPLNASIPTRSTHYSSPAQSSGSIYDSFQHKIPKGASG